ncbi:MAG: ATP-binding protein, partial [Devosia sp.]
LIVTELLINAIKYAFPESRPDARIRVTYEVSGSDWKLTVADNGIGKSPDEVAKLESGGGLGTAIVAALVRQLEAQMQTATSPGQGMNVSIERATFQPRVVLPLVAYPA